jgi:hypothetical protein
MRAVKRAAMLVRDSAANVLRDLDRDVLAVPPQIASAQSTSQ